jgi:hypothetical protein
MVIRDLPSLVDSVQRNCHIADARHARDMTMCTYLLEMRDHYRWEHELPPQQPTPRAEIGRWLSEREALWDTLAEEPYVDLPIAGAFHTPFDSKEINRTLAPQGLLYGAGYGRSGRPHFFLARLLRDEHREDVRVRVCGCEYARDITAIPAALQGDAIVVRQEALQQWLAQKTEAWSLKHNDGAMKCAMDAYGFSDAVEASAAALARMVEAETETLILHELGEFAVGKCLGPHWEEMLAGLGNRHAELLARAVRDHWADCLVTLPTLIERQARASLHFWFANLDGLRLEIFPMIKSAYAAWRERGDAAQLHEAVERGREHWQNQAECMLALWRRDGPAAAEDILRQCDRL